MADHVFISHASESLADAQALCARIEAKGVKAWIAPRDVRPGNDYSEELQSAIEGCFAFVILVTEKANTSPYVRAETELAFSNAKPIFPVRLSDIQPAPGLAFFLKIRHWTNGFGADRDSQLESLCLELKAQSGRAAPAAAAPITAPPDKARAPETRPAPSRPPEPAPASAASANRRSHLPILAIGAAVALLLIILQLTGHGVSAFGPPATAPDRAFAGELADFGIEPQAELETNVGAPTPMSLPVGRRLTTGEVQRMVAENSRLLLVDVLAAPHPQTLQGALYMPAGGMPGSFSDSNQALFAQQLAGATGGDVSRPIIFFCQGASCWESYNAALRARAAGQTEIYWYRGGLAAWLEAGLPTSPLPVPVGQGGKL